MKLNVRRQIFVALGIIFGLFKLYAQEGEDLEIGGNLGLSFAGVSTAGENNTQTIATFNVGASGEYYFSDRWGVKLKLISDNKGYSKASIYDVYFKTFTTVIELNYITIPVMANWHFSRNRRWYLSFGPYLGLLRSAKDSESQADLKSQINGTDYGLAFDIGYKIKINKKSKLFIEYDGQLGIKNIIAGENDYSVWNNRGAYNIGVLIDL